MNRERFGLVKFIAFVFVASTCAAIVVPLGQVWVTRMIALRNIGYDLGFVINRAAVFTGVSIVLVGTFVLVEWILGEWFASIGHATNVFVSAAVALGLGLSVRTIHGRVDALLDNIFFRKRHENEQALRTFARETPYITSATVLLERAGECLRSRANASTVSFTLNCGIKRYDGVAANYPKMYQTFTRCRLN